MKNPFGAGERKEFGGVVALGALRAEPPFADPDPADEFLFAVLFFHCP